MHYFVDGLISEVEPEQPKINAPMSIADDFPASPDLTRMFSYVVGLLKIMPQTGHYFDITTDAIIAVISAVACCKNESASKLIMSTLDTNTGKQLTLASYIRLVSKRNISHLYSLTTIMLRHQ